MVNFYYSIEKLLKFHYRAENDFIYFCAGFSEVSSACCGYGTLRGLLQCGKEGYEICSNPNEFLFWDYFHPSEHAYELISKSLWDGNKFQVRPINLKTLVNFTRAHA